MVEGFSDGDAGTRIILYRQKPHKRFLCLAVLKWAFCRLVAYDAVVEAATLNPKNEPSKLPILYSTLYSISSPEV
jgi:hypothetical protein